MSVYQIIALTVAIAETIHCAPRAARMLLSVRQTAVWAMLIVIAITSFVGLER